MKNILFPGLIRVSLEGASDDFKECMVCPNLWKRLETLKRIHSYFEGLNEIIYKQIVLFELEAEEATK